MRVMKIEVLRKISDKVNEISAECAYAWLQSNEAILIDVREPDELELEWIPGAIAMPLSRFKPGDVPINNDLQIMLICYTGRRSKKAAKLLAESGIYPVYSVRDGILGWNASGLDSVDQSALLI